MNKFHLYCLFYAFKEKTEKINELYKDAKKEFELTKFKKHFSKGKTTKHRKGKEEKKMGRTRSKFRKVCYIKYYKKMIAKNPDILSNLEMVSNKSAKNVEDFLNC